MFPFVIAGVILVETYKSAYSATSTSASCAMTLRCDMNVPPPAVASNPTVAMSVCSPLLSGSSAGLTDSMFDPHLDALFGLDDVDMPFLSTTWPMLEPDQYAMPTLSASMPFTNTNGSLTPPPPPPQPPIQLPPDSLVPMPSWPTPMPSCSTFVPTFSSRSASASASSAAALLPVLTTGAAPSAQLQTLEGYAPQRVSAQSPPPAFPWKQDVISSLMPPPEPTTALDHCAGASYALHHVGDTRGPLPVSAWSLEPMPLPLHAVPPASGTFTQLLEPCPEFAWPNAALTPASPLTHSTALPLPLPAVNRNRGTQLPATSLYAPTLVSSSARQQLSLPLPPPPPPPASANQSQQRTRQAQRTSRQSSLLEALLSSNTPSNTHSSASASGGLFGEAKAPARRGAPVGPPAVTAPVPVQSLERAF